MPSKAAVLTIVCSLNVAVIIGVMWLVQYFVDRGRSIGGGDDDDDEGQGVGPWWKYVMLVFMPPVLMTPTIAYSFYVMGFMHRGCCKKSVQDGGEMQDVPETGLLDRTHGIQAIRGHIGLVIAGSFFSAHSNPLVPLECNDRPPAYGEVVLAPGGLGLVQDHGHGLGCAQCGRRPATPQDGTRSTTATLASSGYVTTSSSSTNNCSCSMASSYSAAGSNQISGSLEEKPPDYNTAVLMKGC